MGQGLALHGLMFLLSLEFHPDAHDRLGFEHFQYTCASHSVDDRMKAVLRQLHHLVNPNQRTEFVEIYGRRLVRVRVPLRQDQYHLVLLKRFVQRLDRSRPVGHQRGRHMGIHDQVAHRQHGDGLDHRVLLQVQRYFLERLDFSHVLPRFPCPCAASSGVLKRWPPRDSDGPRASVTVAGAACDSPGHGPRLAVA